MRRLALLLATIVTIALFSTMPLQANVGSREFPNDQGAGCNVSTGSSKITLGIQYGGPLPSGPFFPPVTLKADDNFAGACVTGATITANLANKLCESCLTQGGTIKACGPTPCVPVGVISCAGIPVASGTFTCALGGAAGVDRVTVDNNSGNPTPPGAGVVATSLAARIMGFSSSTTAGNTLSADLLPDLQVQITPLGFDGVVTFHSEFVAGGGPSFTVNTAGKKAIQIGQEIGAGFITMGYPASNVTVLGPIVRVRNIHTLNNNVVRNVSIRGVPGMLVEMGNSSPDPALVPAVSEWTIALFIGLVLLMGTWLLRRRLTTQAV